jgi:hypothetical protein
MSEAAEHDWAREAQGKVKKLLDEMGVKRVVLVDDGAYQVSKSLVELAQPYKLGEATWDRKGDYEPFFAGAWGACTPAQRRVAQDAAVKKAPELASADIDVMRVLFSGAQWLTASPQQWVEDPAACLSDAGPAGSLVFFDRNLGSEGGPDGGAALLGDYRRSDDSARAVLLTSTIEAEDELEIPGAVVSAAGLSSAEILIASKEHLTREHSMAFVDFVRMSLTLENLETIRDQVKEALQVAHTEAVSKLVSLHPRLIEDIVIRASRREGIWEVDTYLRIFEIYQRQALHEAATVQHDKRLLKAIADARRSAAIVHIDHEPSKQVVTELMAAENYASGELINKAGLPLENGDVFKSAGKYYVLAIQPCDIAFRDDARGIRADTKFARLLPVTPMQEPSKEPSKRQQKLPLGFAQLIGDGEATAANPYFVSLSQARHLSLEILDLCTFDAGGRARMDIRNPLPLVPLLTPGQTKRYGELHKKVAASSESKLDSEGPPIMHLNVEGDLPPSPHWHSQAQILRFDFQRVGRLAAEYSAQMLTSFSRDASRAAYAPSLEQLI